jgi:hypothetical protein
MQTTKATKATTTTNTGAALVSAASATPATIAAASAAVIPASVQAAIAATQAAQAAAQAAAAIAAANPPQRRSQLLVNNGMQQPAAHTIGGQIWAQINLACEAMGTVPTAKQLCAWPALAGHLTVNIASILHRWRVFNGLVVPRKPSTSKVAGA